MLKKILKLFRENKRSFFSVLFERCFRFLPDSLYLKGLFFIRMGYCLKLKNPQTFCEKLQWLKINDRKPEYSKLVDKLEVKKYIAEKIGEEYVIPTYNVWDKLEDVDFDTLPNQFVLKTTHGGGGLGVILCNDKRNFDKIKSIACLKRALSQNIFDLYREWPYKNIMPRIMAEKMMKQEDGSPLVDYKFFCFNGEPKFVYIRHGEDEENIQLSFLTMDWEYAPFYNPKYPQYKELPPKPKLFDEMKDVAALLSKNHVFLRVDLYLINNHIYFSELTFYPGSGMMILKPNEWDKNLGDMINLNLIKNNLL